MNIPEVLQQFALDAKLEFFSITTTNIGGNDTFSFHNGVNGVNGVNAPIVWQGVTYTPYPIKAEGFETSTKGTLARPHLTVSNVLGAMTAVVIALDDLAGAQVTRKTTFSQFLDGQPGADPGQHLPDDVYYVERKVSEIPGETVEFELASALDLEGIRLPRRPLTSSRCVWEYRKTECGYTGSACFDSADNPVGTLAEDHCSHTVNGCKIRFGQNARLNFGGFPGVKTYKY